MIIFFLGCSNDKSLNRIEFPEGKRLKTVYSDSAYWCWGGSCIKTEGGIYHIFMSRWPKSSCFSPSWVTSSEVVHLISDSLHGPYVFSDIALPRRGKEFWDGMMACNPSIQKYKDTFLLFYTGTTYDFTPPDSGYLPRKEEYKLARENQRIGVAWSLSPFGPWNRRDNPILDVGTNSWDAEYVTNPTTLIDSTGDVILVYKSRKYNVRGLKLGLASSDNYIGKYNKLFERSINSSHYGLEDPFIYKNGYYILIYKKFPDKGEKTKICYSISSDGINWDLSSYQAFPDSILTMEGEYPFRLEQPSVFYDNGENYLLLATGIGNQDSLRDSFLSIIKIEMPDE